MSSKSFKYFTFTEIIIFISSIFITSCKELQKKEEQEQEHEATVDSEWIDTEQHIYEYGICIDSLNITRYEIKTGDNPSSIFSKLGFSTNMSDSLCKASSDVLDPRKLRSGMTYSTLSTQDSLQTIKYIVFAKSMVDFSIIDLSADTIKAYEYNKEVRLERRYMEGVINTSLWKMMKRNGADPLLALMISDIFAWQIDFFDVKDGDSFRVAYDVALIDDTTELNISSIEGLIFTHQGKTYTAFPFTQGKVREYFDSKGNSLKKAFLKAPLDFFRITSRFSNARFHPILKRYRAHHGVDYAAPGGTPIKSIGDGTVIAKGYDSKGGGNYVKIKHNSVYTTTYMHMSRFAKGVRTGAHIRQGEVIGYVGSTGLSTGPHLDFRVFKNGKPINPLSMESPPSEPIKPALLDSFMVIKRNVMAEMDSLRINNNNKEY